MKRTLLFFACLLGMLTSFSASAQWKCMVTEVVSTTGVSCITASQMKDLPGVQKVVVGLLYGSYGRATEWANPIDVTLSNNGQTVKPSSVNAVGMNVTLEFNTPLTNGGSYTINVPANIAHYAENGADSWNQAFTLIDAFSIKGNETPVDPTPATNWQYSITQIYNAAGDVVVADSYQNVEGLSKLVVDLAYPGEFMPTWNTSSVDAYLTLNGNKVAATSVSAIGRQITMTFDPALTTPGTYAVVIGKDCAQNSAGEWNPEIVINNAFTLKAPAPKPAYTMTWGNVTSLNNGEENLYASEGADFQNLSGVKSFDLPLTVTPTPEGLVNRPQYNEALLADTYVEANGKKTLVSEISGFNGRYTFTFAELLTEAGSYTVNLPEGLFFMADGSKSEQASIDVFSIKSDTPVPTTKWQAGINEIYNAAGDVVVYQNEDSYKNVEGLSKLVVDLAYPGEFMPTWNTSSVDAYLTLNGNKVAATSVSAIGRQITMTFDPALLTPGTYAVVIGKDCAQNSAGEWNPEIVINNAFALKEAAPAPKHTISWSRLGLLTVKEGESIDAGGDVQNLESVTDFNFYMTIDPALTNQELSDFPKIDESLIPYTYVEVNGERISPKSVAVKAANYCEFVFDPILTAAGEYSLYLPEGLVYMQNDGAKSAAGEFKNIFSIKGEEPQPTHTITWTGLGLLTVKDGEYINAGDNVQNLESVADFNFYMKIDPALSMFEKYTDSPKINESLIPSTYVEVNGERISPKSVTVKSNYCEFAFDPILTAAGTYSLYLPEGLVYMQNDGAKSEAAEFLNIFSIKDNEDPKPTFNLTDYTLDPESGAELPYIAGIELKFPESGVDGDEYFFSMDEELAVTLTDEAGKEYNPVRMGIMMTDIDAYVISFGSVDSGTAIMTPGTYTLVIPEGKFFIYDTDAKNPRIEATYVIKSPGVSFDNYGLNPANGSTVTTLGHIYLTFPDAVSEDNLDNYIEPNVDLFEDLTEIYLTDPNGEKIGLEDLTMSDDITLDLVFGDYREWVEGEYTLTVPAAFFRCSEYPAVVSPAITATYTLVAAVDPLAEWTIDPAEGKVESLEKFVITYPYITENGGYINGPEEGTTAALYKDGVKVTDAYVGSIEYKQIRITLDEEITAPGEYTLIVDGDMFCYESSDGVYGNYNPEMKFSYTIDTPDGVEAILAGADNFTVVDAAGRVIVRNGEKSVLSQLEKGLYIINGQKVVIRK